MVEVNQYVSILDSHNVDTEVFDQTVDSQLNLNNGRRPSPTAAGDLTMVDKLRSKLLLDTSAKEASPKPQ